MPFGDDAFHHVTREIDGNSKTDSHAAAAATDNGRGNADQPPEGIDKGATRIAWIDGCIGLNEILVINNAEPTATGGADNAHRDSLTDTEWVADSQHDISNLQRGTIGDGTIVVLRKWEISPNDIIINVSDFDYEQFGSF